MKMTRRRSIIASRIGPSVNCAGRPKNGSVMLLPCTASLGTKRSPIRPVRPPPSSQSRICSAEPRWPIGMMPSSKCGASACSTLWIMRALPGYITIATRSPGWLVPTACSASKLPRCAPSSIAPRPSSTAVSTSVLPRICMSNTSMRPLANQMRSSATDAKAWMWR